MSEGSRGELPAAGTLIANRFQLRKKLGQGAMGSVWVAWHTTLGIEVAIKFVDTKVAELEGIGSRFEQEARTAAALKSPHIVNIIDYGVDGGHPYIAMELLDGQPLSQRLKSERSLSLQQTAQVVAQACKGLAKAHAAGVVHRDLKPDNIFLCEDESGFLVKLVDFGIAKARFGGESSHQTRTGQLLGTPAFMSPEQAYGRKTVDFRSDLYSVGVVAFYCLTGRVPFEADALGELLITIVQQPAPAPSSFRSGLSPAIDAWMAKALDKAPERRFQSAKEMADRFLACAGDVPALATAPDLTGDTSVKAGTLAGTANTSITSGAPRTLAVLAVVALALAGLVAALGAYLVLKQEKPAPISNEAASAPVAPPAAPAPSSAASAAPVVAVASASSTPSAAETATAAASALAPPKPQPRVRKPKDTAPRKPALKDDYGL
jgi:eukaryotic-like serine/threonine-protein kinase